INTLQDFKQIREAVSQRKRLGLSGDGQRFAGEPDREHILLIDEGYRQLLEDAHALDYDDLIIRGIQLLRDDLEVANSIHHRFHYIFVDEFHDVSREQFELLRQIAPPRPPDESHHVSE